MQENTLKGVNCEVEGCIYNNGECCCTAPSIKVKAIHDVLNEESICETFEEA